MNQYEVPALIADSIPELETAMKEQTATFNINSVLHTLAAYTQKMCAAHNLPAIQQCMKLADKLYTKGNTAVQNAVINVFVYSFSVFRITCHKMEWKQLQPRIPVTLYSVYVQQVLKSGM
ncbi:hypothetical protein HNQ91_003764 [Filimonas zeae]|uniref:DUF7674 domain-containing protein n=1 Tax=Filimonas zeae TaxID=1737353 RepID=A0A917MXL2_9BACT|nr:hypothetical protein [Filimonas zeae]MDR6340699.1 hypothetical protein [Filimonas zeae]GGH73954.1 hypothetical protein GCM10011379_36050 [Filimonas zeae]